MVPLVFVTKGSIKIFMVWINHNYSTTKWRACFKGTKVTLGMFWYQKSHKNSWTGVFIFFFSQQIERVFKVIHETRVPYIHPSVT
jgi:hypothetical protein